MGFGGGVGHTETESDRPLNFKGSSSGEEKGTELPRFFGGVYAGL